MINGAQYEKKLTEIVQRISLQHIRQGKLRQICFYALGRGFLPETFELALQRTDIVGAVYNTLNSFHFDSYYRFVSNNTKKNCSNDCDNVRFSKYKIIWGD